VKTATNVLEIGVYLGHSLLILLISNPNLKITCIDNDARFSPKAVEYLNSHFGNRVTFFLGDAVDIINSLTPISKFDMVHVDADHNNEAVLKQFHAAKKIACEKAYFVFDDYEATRGAVDSLLVSNVLKKLVLPMCLWTNIVTQLN
jgi:predicted O-methyltransferase YrrM